MGRISVIRKAATGLASHFGRYVAVETDMAAVCLREDLDPRYGSTFFLWRSSPYIMRKEGLKACIYLVHLDELILYYPD